MNTVKMSGRNSMIEIMRFLASLWVISFHDMFFITNSSNYFKGGKLAVDFFFILSGLFFVKSYKQNQEKTLLNNFWSFSKNDCFQWELLCQSV